MGDGDILGDGIAGPETPENMATPENEEMRGMEQGVEAELRNKLVTDAYGTKIPQRRTVDRD